MKNNIFKEVYLHYEKSIFTVLIVVEIYSALNYRQAVDVMLESLFSFYFLS